MAPAIAGYRIHNQHVAASMLVIQSLDGIAEAGCQFIGGIEQWIQIRGEDRNNPVILFLSMLPVTWRTMRAWEKRFTIVHWDQRGAGRTFTRNAAPANPVTIDQLVADGLDVAEFARQTGRYAPCNLRRIRFPVGISSKNHRMREFSC